jgi:predicted metal-dependent phosphoesterase TrpH
MPATRVRLESPYRADGSWLRGNLHTHTNRSDGAASPQTMAMVYAARGYDFLALSDHDRPPLVSGLDPCGLALLPAVEVSLGCPHVLALGVRGPHAATAGQQALLDAIRADGGFAVPCHPNWEEDFNHYSWEQLRALTGFAGIEIFNGVCIEQAGSHLALDKWDRLLGLGRTVWGYANDDAHTPDDVGRGWNVVRAADRSPAAILDALRTGSFYASSGVTFERLACEGATLHVRAPDARRLALYTRHGRRVREVEGPEMDFDATEFPGPFVRVEAYGSGGAAAWSQPILVRGGRWDELQARLRALDAQGRSVLRVTRVARPPAPTGRVDDPLWSGAEAFDRFLVIGDGSPAPVRTEVRALATDDTLFLGFRCEEPLPEMLGAAGPDALWRNDSIEVLLDPEGRGEGAHHLLIGVLGDQFAGCRGAVSGPAAGIRGAAAVSREGAWRGWTAELAVSLDRLGGRPAAGARWGFHLCRNRFPERGNYVWSWVGASNHNRHLYGTLAW